MHVNTYIQVSVTSLENKVCVGTGLYAVFFCLCGSCVQYEGNMENAIAKL